MTAYTLARKLAAPVCCLACKWLGKCGDLVSMGTDTDGLKCPQCRSTNIKWIESEAPAAAQ